MEARHETRSLRQGAAGVGHRGGGWIGLGLGGFPRRSTQRKGGCRHRGERRNCGAPAAGLGDPDRHPLLIGTTGWTIPDLAEQVGDRTAVLLAPNFSLTMALYARLSLILARFAALDEATDPYLVEHHHARKHDAPSGTAKQLAATLLKGCPRKTEWVIPGVELPLLRINLMSPASARVTPTAVTRWAWTRPAKPWNSPMPPAARAALRRRRPPRRRLDSGSPGRLHHG